MNQKKIAIIFGGCSTEYEISLQSASAVIRNMNTDLFHPVMIGISRTGNWYYFDGELSQIESDNWCNEQDCTPAMISQNRNENCLILFRNNHIVKLHIDAAFPVLHGKNGEDGTVQGLLELAGISVIGCGTLASALCMDKDRSHKLVQSAGIPIPPSFLIEEDDFMKQSLPEVQNIVFPVFVKPIKSGSSIGITKVTTPEELIPAVKTAFIYDSRVIVEECIEGFEIGCSVLEEKNGLFVGEIDEIELSKGYFDFTEKYSLQTSKIHVPARIDAETAERAKELARKIFIILDCKGFARVDMFLEPSGNILFNEVNTIPGLTTHSRFPGMLTAKSISLEQMITMAVSLVV